MSSVSQVKQLKQKACLELSAIEWKPLQNLENPMKQNLILIKLNRKVQYLWTRLQWNEIETN